MHGPRSQNAPERGADQCKQPDGAGRWCRQLRATGMERCTRQRRAGAGTPCRRSMQSLRTNARRSAPCNRPAESFAQTLSAFARHIRSTPYSVQTLGAFAHQLDGIAAPARTVKAFLLRMPGFWLTLSISGDRLRPFGVKKTSLAMSALRYPLFWHVFIAKCRTQRTSARKPRRLSAINRQS